MSNSETLNKIQISSLLQEVKLLRSVVIGWVGKDSEGQYNPKFVKQVLKDSKEKNIYSFKGKKSFIHSLNSLSNEL